MLSVNYKHCCFAPSKPKTKRLQNKNPLRTPYYLSRLKSRGVAIADREGERALRIVILWKRIQRRDSTLSWTSSLTLLLRNPSPIPGFLLLSLQFPILYQFVCLLIIWILIDSSPISCGAIQISSPSRGKKRDNRESALALVEHVSSADAPLCRPWDRGDLMRRLATFKSMTWFAKPKVHFILIIHFTITFLAHGFFEELMFSLQSI